MANMLISAEPPLRYEPTENAHAKDLVQDVLDTWESRGRLGENVDQIALADEIVDTLVGHGLTIPGDWAQHISPFHGEARAVAVQEGDSDV